MSIALSVNLNKIALLRNSRTDNNPNIEKFAHWAIDAGSSGLTAHPRPDQRHIRVSDIPILSAISKMRRVEFNIEGNPFSEPRENYPGLLKLVERVKPEQCTLVPDNDAQLTSDHGFDLTKDATRLKPIISTLKELGIRVSLFMDPAPLQIELAYTLGADRIELYTGPFAAAFSRSAEEGKSIFEEHKQAALFAQKLGLGVNAGHDLNLANLALYSQIPGLKEVSIGHALTADALDMGFEKAVAKYASCCS